MIIDAHTHTFPPQLAPSVIPALEKKACSRAYTAGTDKALSASMQQAGIDISILLPVMTNPAQVKKLNDIAIKKNEQSAVSGLISLGGMHPDYEDYTAELRRIAAAGIPGIKLHPAYQGTDLDDVRYLHIMDAAAQLDLAIVIHAGLDIGIMHHNFSSVKHILRVIEQVAPPKFVLAHMGSWKGWDAVESELCGAPVFFDTSFSLGSYVPPDGCCIEPKKRQMLSTRQFTRIVKKHGSDKILFGSDSPWSDQREAIEQIKACPLSQNDFAAIFSQSARRVFNIQPPAAS